MRRLAASIPCVLLPAESVMLASFSNWLVAVSTSPIWRADRNVLMTSPGVGLLAGGRAETATATAIAAITTLEICRTRRRADWRAVIVITMRPRYGGINPCQVATT